MRLRCRAGSLTTLAITCGLMAAPSALAAQVPEPSPEPVRGPANPVELEAFLDGLLAAQMADANVAGATVAVVRDGAVLLLKGYGYADVEQRTRVDPARTLFRIGSVSKLFTWTAVMQLAQQGAVDLDADVNTYIDFEIPATFEEPITLRHIMSHTPGFEEDARGLFADDSTDIEPLGEWLVAHLPARVRPPGTYSAYSNYATALAGYVVERVSGMSWDEYIEQNILTPLGMTQTTGRQPLPAQLVADMARGYQYSADRYESKPFEIITGASPAGSISASASDMATFMMAHLGRGAVGVRRILDEETAVQMQTRGFAHDERLPGWGLGFYEKSSNGLRIIGHGGDTQWFHSDFVIIPEEHVGVFVSYNTDTGGGLSGPFIDAFLDHYYPAPPTPVTMPEDAAEQAARVVGTYQMNRMSYTTWQKAMGLAGAASVSAAEDGSLLFKAGDEPMRLVPVGPLLYREEMGDELVAFEEDENGRVTHAFIGAAPMVALERMPWYAVPVLHQILLGLSLVVFVGTIIAAVSRFLRRRFGQPRPEDQLGGRAFTIAIASLNVAFVIALVILSTDFWALVSGPDTKLRAALLLPVLAGLLTIGAIAMAVRHWRSGAGTRGARLRYSAVIAFSIVFLWSLNTWNLLGWRM